MAWQTTPARTTAAAIIAVAGGLAALRLVIPAAATPAVLVPAPYRSPHLAPAKPSPPKRAPSVSPRAAGPAPIIITHVIDTGGPLRFGDYFWDAGAPPAGPLTITIDLKSSVLSVFRGGYEVGTTAVIYGADAKQTPLGIFPILQKDEHHFSSTYHHAPMPYTLRLTGDGVSIHASEIAANYATHGCIGVPAGFAKRLFAIASVGDRVIVTSKGVGAALSPS